MHDLRNPHHHDRRLHDEQLDVLVPAADALITLTPGAAQAIEERWGRTAQVLPHPYVVDLPTVSLAMTVRSRRIQRPFRVGLHLKCLRATMDPLRILPTLVDTVAGLGDAVLQVNCHRDILDPDGARRDVELAAYLRAEESRGHLDLVAHDHFSDQDPWSYLASLDVSVPTRQSRPRRSRPGTSRASRSWAIAARAALSPHAPCTPPPGWAEADPR